ncbi:MAG: hypothetical protein JO352_38955 [Chloroflexi bacterium]|nr:hypothetical protein [Chloroflexota bacterium]
MVHTAVVLMRPLLGQLVVQLLVGLLVLTTPIGTGEGVHQNELLHPVLPHVHTINGQIVSDQQLALDRVTQTAAAASSPPISGAALGAGSGADAAGLGIALGPTLPALEPVRVRSVESRLVIEDSAAPAEFRAEVQDPPPDRIA